MAGMLLACLWAVTSPTALAHYISISHGNLIIDGAGALYQLRMPAYELIHTRQPDRMLLESVRLRGDDEEARVGESSCQLREEEGAYVCEARFVFSAEPRVLRVRCTFHTVTVANHVHVLRVRKRTPSGEEQESRAVFDLSHPEAEIRFLPPSRGEIMLRELLAGATRTLGTFPPWLMLWVVALAARRFRDLFVLLALLTAGELSGLLVARLVPGTAGARFGEAALALGVAYAASDILLLPESKFRRFLIALVGLPAGVLLAVFARETQATLSLLVSGAMAAQLPVLMVLGGTQLKLRKIFDGLPVLGALSALALAAALSWFFLLLRGR